MHTDLHFVFRKSQRDRFRSGDLIREWRKHYPNIFDAHDELVLQTPYQRTHNFYEWLAAVLIFESMGYLSLVVKYTAKSHASKHVPLRSCLTPPLADWVFKNETGQPDLFVYSVDHKDWFFCEVKGPRDRIRPNQETWRAGLNAFFVNQPNMAAARYRVFSLSEVDA